MEDILKIAIQKSGRLSDKSIDLLKDCGINFNSKLGKLSAKAHNYPVELLLLRDDDIPGYVEDSVADIGIVGENVYLEKGDGLKIVDRLGFSKCRLSLAVPKGEEYQSVEQLNGQRIATSYPHILSKFLKEKGVEAHIHEISGSVEIAPGIGLSDAVCDIVSSGSTLMMNGLKEVEVILRSEAVIIGRQELTETKDQILQDLMFRVQAVKTAKNNKYILLNAPNDNIDAIISILPGMKSPTVLPLAQEGWSSVHTVVKEDEFWQIIGKLREYGAEGILVVPIEKMIV